MNSGVQDGSVCGAMSTSPGWNSAMLAVSWMMRAPPRATPADAGPPCRTAPGLATSTSASARRAPSFSGLVPARRGGSFHRLQPRAGAEEGRDTRAGELPPPLLALGEPLPQRLRLGDED